MRQFILIFMLSAVFHLSNANEAHAGTLSESQLNRFADLVFKIHQNQNRAGYLKLIHPDCPAPMTEALDYNFSVKWLDNKDFDIRVKSVEEVYDFSQLDFTVIPQAVLEYQVWTQHRDGSTIELVTGVAVALHEGDLRIIDYPCFTPK